MGDDFKLPVERLPVVLLLADGSRHEVQLFIPSGQPADALLESRQAFLPAADVSGRLRLFQRGALAGLRIGAAAGPRGAEDPEAPPPRRRAVVVMLRCGARIPGELRYLAARESSRTTDYLNGPSVSFELHADDGVYQIAKRHVAYVEESS
jgi:hypothetical protein